MESFNRRGERVDKKLLSTQVASAFEVEVQVGTPVVSQWVTLHLFVRSVQQLLHCCLPMNSLSRRC